MSDPPAPKPKPGSLRDRIAAFEHKPTAPSGPAPPAPRPKGALHTWKPRPVSPPPAPSGETVSSKTPGMSASDAKESIGRGGTLKERMAALQGSGAFGGGAPAPPVPRADKPKWKPPPQVVKTPPIDGEEQEDAEKDEGEGAPVVHRVKAPAALENVLGKSPSPAAEGEAEQHEAEGEKEGEGEDGEEKEVDPEEEERARRAAIAARMARLGGARVGMGPPIFGRKPDVPPKKPVPAPKKDDDDDGAAPAASPPVPAAATSPPVPAADEAASPKPQASGDYFPPQPEQPEAASSPRPPSVHSTTSAHSTPSPAVMPSIPRRAMPPRKKAAAKSPSPASPPASAPEEKAQPEAPIKEDSVLPESISRVPEEVAVPEPAPVVDNVDVQEVAAKPERKAEEEVEPKVEEQPKILDVPTAISPSPVTSPEAPVVEPHVEAARQEEVGQVGKSADEDAAKEGIVAPPAFKHEEEEQPQVEEKDDDVESATSDPRPDDEDDPASYVKPKRGLSEAELEGADEPAREGVPLAHEEPEHTGGEEEEAEKPEEAEEEDEETRKKRIAERIAKMGGFNPFSGPPPQHPAEEQEDEQAEPEREIVAKAEEHKEIVKEEESEADDDDYGAAQEQEEPLDEAAPRPEDRGAIETDIVAGANPAEYGVLNRETRVAHEAGDLDQGERYHDQAHREEEEAGADEDGEGEDVDESGQRGDDGDARAHDHRGASEEAAAHPAADDYDHPEVDSAPEHEYAHELEHELNDADDEDEMAPPRIHRPLPPAPAPIPNAATRPDIPTPSSPPPPPTPSKRISIPPPARAVPPPVPTSPKEDIARSPSIRSAKRTSIPPPARSVPVPTVDEDPDTPAPPPPARRTSTRSSARTAPAPAAAPVHSPVLDNEAHQLTQEPEALAPAPAHAHDAPHRDRPHVPSPYVPTERERERRASADKRRSFESRGSSSLDIDRRALPAFVAPQPAQAPHEGAHRPPPVAVAPQEPEVLDDSDGDPIDPRFFSPMKSSFPPRAPPPTAAIPESAVPQPEQEQEHEEQGEKQEETQSAEDAETVRRRTIAERMAKLGGIRFGAPPPPPPVRKVQPPGEGERAEGAEEGQPGEEAPRAHGQEEEQEETEEDEMARRARIAAKIAGMGGMRFGMLPGQVVVPPAPAPVRHEEPGVASPPPPARAAPPPARAPPPPAHTESEEEDGMRSGTSVSSDGVKVEAEESELEEVIYEDAMEEEEVVEQEEEEAPPPPPPRTGRPPVPTGRPPVPQGLRRSSEDAGPAPPPLSPRPTARKDSYDTVTPQMPHRTPPAHAQSDYVIVEQEVRAPQVPPPPPPHAPMPPPPPPAPASEAASTGGWELPSIPTGGLDFGDSATEDLSASMWSEDSTAYPPAPAHVPPPPAKETSRAAPPPAAPHPPANMSAEELRAVWGRVGVQVHESAVSLLERSKRTLIGNGSYAGFVDAVLTQVPNAAAGGSQYGFLVYEQTGGSVHVRASEIMPGDVIVLEDAKLKGHKGIQSYHQAAGEGGVPCVGVVSEFEVRKMKVKALQANQHVGQATVESVSYRLDDLKSGTIKVYRVLEA